MPVRVEVWDSAAGKTVPMYSCDASEAVKNDPRRYSLNIPEDAPSSPPSREPDMPFDFLLNGKSTKAPHHERVVSRTKPLRSRRR